MSEFADIKSNEEDAASDDEAEFEVEAILNRRKRNNKLEYFVKWKGYPTSDNTWEPIEHLTNCADLVTTFDYNFNSLKNHKGSVYNTEPKRN
jgi:chromobox protein 1